MRDHQPIVIDKFNGLWKRDATASNPDSCPLDHFPDCKNLRFNQNGVETRRGIEPFLEIPAILRMYTFNQENGQSILALDSSGNIYDSGSATPLIPILSVVGMTDFAFVPFAGRAFLSPHDGTKGLQNEFVYIYEGDGSLARKAAGAGPTTLEGALSAAAGAAGHVESGYHVFGAVYETDSGFLTNIGPDTLPFILADGTTKIDLSNIPVSASSTVTKVHIVATKAINPAFWTGDTLGYEFFFIPGAEVNNGTTTLTVDFFDADLLDSADDLFDLFEEIPAGAVLSIYHNRLVVGTTYTDISLFYVSNQGEPEAINEISGLLIFPLDGNPITNAQEYRDVLYGYKQKRTNAWTDNGDVPSSWPMTLLDQGIGCSLHGLATVLDSGGVNVDFLITSDYSGIYLFNGAYVKPELSWKIDKLWLALTRADFNKIQIVNDTVNKFLYILLTDGTMLFANYANGLEPKTIRWMPWDFEISITSITLYSTDELVLSSDELYEPPA
jgi:hypothetical protein